MTVDRLNGGEPGVAADKSHHDDERAIPIGGTDRAASASGGSVLSAVARALTSWSGLARLVVFMLVLAMLGVLAVLIGVTITVGPVEIRGG